MLIPFTSGKYVMLDEWTQPDEDTRPDALTGILANAVLTRDGLCLICGIAPARFSGLWCAGEGSMVPTYRPGYCQHCDEYPALYCSAECASRGR